MKRAALLASTAAPCIRPVQPKDFPNDPIGRYFRGVQFGWDDAEPQPFLGLQPRFGKPMLDLGHDGDPAKRSIWIVRWGGKGPNAR